MPGSVNCTFNNNVVWQVASVPAYAPQPATVYMWHGITTELLHLYTDCYKLLSIDEQARANRYLQTADRQRYVIQHGLLRLLLGWYLGSPVFGEAFEYGPHQKPYLAGCHNHTCYFNLSNSAGEFLIAIGDTELGIDIACLEPGFAYQDIASHYFGTDELAFITASENSTEAFFLLWTRKEALLKATGNAIDDSLPQIPALNGKHVLPDNYDDTDWLTESFKAGDGYIASVTYPSSLLKLQLSHVSY